MNRQYSTLEASKYTSLERLKQIQKDHYVGENQIDYDSESVDELIRIKQSNKAEETIKAQLADLDEYEEYLHSCS